MFRRLIAKGVQVLGLSSFALQNKIFSEIRRALKFSSDFPGVKLPPAYGKGLPERVIEVLLARLSYQKGAKILDVAHANAMACHLRMIKSLEGPRDITGLDIAKPSYETSQYYERSFVGDITNTPFDNGEFQQIWCVSALEHFGMDNSLYTADFSKEAAMDLKAVREMLRILCDKGTLLITVPYGSYENHGWFKNYDLVHWGNITNILKEHGCPVELYFKYKADGWLQVPPEELADTGYYDAANSGAAGLAVAYLVKNG